MTQMKLLVVDDEDMVRSFFAAFLRHRGDSFETAASGAEALAKLERDTFDVLVTDLNMPGMNGIELVARASRMQPNLVSILLTGRATKQDMVDAIKANVFDYVEKPVTDLQAFSFALERAADKGRLMRERAALMELLQEQNARLEEHLGRLHRAHEQLVRQDELLKADLGRAQRLQQSLLPRGFPPAHGMDFYGFYQPCEQLGGDFFDVVPLGDGRVALLVADVAGHGVRSAMVTVILHQLIHAQQLVRGDRAVLGEPALALRYLNQALIAEPFDEPIHVTMGYAVVDPGAREVVYASAGHPQPVVVRGASRRIETLAARGPGLGIEPEPTFGQVRTALADGDFVVLYSDGLTDSRGVGGKQATCEGVMRWALDAAGSSAAEIGDGVEAALGAFQSGETPDDDISFVVILQTPPDAAEHTRAAKGQVRIRAPRRDSGHHPPATALLTVGWLAEACVVRLTGRATWERAPALLAILTQACALPEALVFLELAECESVDSTILGLLYRFGRKVTLVEPTAQVVAQIEELGITRHVRITHEPIARPATMVPAGDDASAEEQMRIVLSAHEALMAESQENRERFGLTVELLRSDLGQAPPASRDEPTKSP
ncbi:MAG: SpoIIE family protein phosphatase [Polyangiaceae bacterium]|nr:SpoIIE family protein phosphatase [Polyangiaceae bacterium]